MARDPRGKSVATCSAAAQAAVQYDPVLPIHEAAAYCGICSDTLRRAARARQLPVVRSNGKQTGKMRFRLSALNAWTKRHEQAAARMPRTA